MKELNGFDNTPAVIRRALSLKEVVSLIKAAPPERSCYYEFAATNGFRFSEVGSLKVRHFDHKNCRITLPASLDKGGKERHCPIPKYLADELARLAVGRASNDSLIPNGFSKQHAHRDFDLDLKKAGIPKVTDDGVACFYSLRKFFIDMIVSSGADPKTFQELARHESLNLTLKTYASKRSDRLRDITEEVGNQILAEKDRSSQIVVKQPIPEASFHLQKGRGFDSPRLHFDYFV